jgi:hypothetical protein
MRKAVYKAKPQDKIVHFLVDFKIQSRDLISVQFHSFDF